MEYRTTLTRPTGTLSHRMGAGRGEGVKAQEPLGSGAIESTCRQYQGRFKRTGQFRSTAGDEALLCLETCWRHGRWHDLYPHAKLASAHLNWPLRLCLPYLLGKL